MKHHHKKLICAKLIMTVLYMSTGFGFVANASSLTQATDIISNSGIGVLASHNLIFSISQSVPVGGYVDVTFAPEFAAIIAVGNITCPLDTVASLQNAGKTARCTAVSQITAPTSTTIMVSDVANPASVGTFPVSISTHLPDTTLIQDTNTQVAITDRVTVTASVPSSLTFVVSPLASDGVINGATTTLSSATSSLDFGSLAFGSSSIMAQELSVLTNAAWGYNVTVQQDQDLTSTNGATIHPFNNGTSSVIAENWATPTADLNASTTFGHFGVMSDDDSMAGSFGIDQWKGFIGTNPMMVMSHNGPVVGQQKGIGTTSVVYRIEVSPLQQAGDYTNILTYICTPTY